VRVPESSFLSVTELNNLLKLKVQSDPSLHNLVVKGEISSWKSYPSATYFDVKDERSVLSCLLWASEYIYLPFEPKIGDEVLLYGYLDVYANRGRYSLICQKIELFGQGKELLALEALKKKLQSEGLFDESRKRGIPEFPSKIGMIVGNGSAAEADLLKNLQRRWPLSDLYVFPSLVQGKEAPKDLLRAFKLSQEYPLDVLIIARGGGSNEDLSAFNDESLCRAVSNSKMPTISAIGHEIDFSILDFIADKRVSTPTAAAEMATPDVNDIRQELDDCFASLSSSLIKNVSSCREKLNSLSNRPFFKNPASAYHEKIERLREHETRLNNATDNALLLKKNEVSSLKTHLEALNPYSVINRGYSLTENEDGKIISSAKDVKEGDRLSTRLKDGIIHSKVFKE
jgi:exodeoxyribonuclease VII large subunit